MQRVENTCSFINIFPEDASSWESWLLLAFSQRDTLTVGFGFAAAANPCSAAWAVHDDYDAFATDNRYALRPPTRHAERRSPVGLPRLATLEGLGEEDIG